MSEVPADRRVVGQPLRRNDSVEKVTGAAEYTFDVEFPHMLWAVAVHSPYAHARIKALDTRVAEEMAGVQAVVTNADFPDHRFGEGVHDQTCLAADRALFEGQFVAVVAAESKSLASQAAQAVEVEYEPLEPVVDGEAAARTDPPAVVHPDLFEYGTSAVLPPNLDEDRPNLYQTYHVRKGDVESGLASADRVYTDTYRTSAVQHAPMEPHVAVARPGLGGSITIWSSCQSLHKIQNLTARILDKDPEKLRVIEPYVGGGFGGKENPVLEPIVGLLADRTGRPVKFVNTRAEEFKTSVSGEVKTTVETGVNDDGDLVARHVDILLPGGAFASTGYMVARNCTFGVSNSYSIPHLEIETAGVYTNTPPSGSFRGFGIRQVLFGLESQLDDIALDLGIDPIEFRRQNLLSEGELTAHKERRTHVQSGALLDAVEAELPLEDPGHPDPWVTGEGVALVNKFCAAPTGSSAIVKVHPNGNVELRYSSDEIGQGNTTAMAQIVAEEFGISMEDVKLVRGDTDVTPYDQGSISSRSTFHMGNAVILACADAKDELFEHAAEVLETSPDDVETRDGRVFPKGAPERGVEIEALYDAQYLESGYLLKNGGKGGGEIIGKASWSTHIDPEAETRIPDPNATEAGRLTAFYSEGACVAQVSVNPTTGSIVVDNLVSAFDVGQAINPALVREQIVGGLSMGLSTTLYEELRFDPDSGQLLNANYADYLIPTAHEHPTKLSMTVLEAGHDEGPYGAKGIGEVPTVVVAPAIANAIRDATGVRLEELPFLPDRVWAGLHESKGDEGT